jgi:tetratricopeptide (TPR) repeat protein
VAYLNLHRWQKAVEAFKQAIRLKPDFAEAHYNLGATYHVLGDRGAALQQHTILVTLQPELANKLVELIYVYKK